MTTATSTRPSPARVERRLLGFALAIVLGAGALLLLAIPADPWPVALAPLLVLAALAAGVHAIVRLLAPRSDPLVLPLLVLLNGLGLVLIRRIDLAQDTSFAINQLVWTAVGLVAFTATLAIVRDHTSLTRLSYTFGLLTLVLLVLPLLPVIGREVNGARLWLDLGPIRMQPGEAAKLTLVVFLAGYLERTRALLTVAQHRIGPLLLPAPRHLAPLLTAVLLALMVLVAQKDLGSSLLLFGIVVVMRGDVADRLPAGGRPSGWVRCWPTACSGTCASGWRSGWTPSPTRSTPATSWPRCCSRSPTAD